MAKSSRVMVIMFEGRKLIVDVTEMIKNESGNDYFHFIGSEVTSGGKVEVRVDTREHHEDMKSRNCI